MAARVTGKTLGPGDVLADRNVPADADIAQLEAVAANTRC
jgi:hypothetical protein